MNRKQKLLEKQSKGIRQREEQERNFSVTLGGTWEPTDGGRARKEEDQ